MPAQLGLRLVRTEANSQRNSYALEVVGDREGGRELWHPKIDGAIRSAGLSAGSRIGNISFPLRSGRSKQQGVDAHVQESSFFPWRHDIYNVKDLDALKGRGWGAQIRRWIVQDFIDAYGTNAVISHDESLSTEARESLHAIGINPERTYPIEEYARILDAYLARKKA